MRLIIKGVKMSKKTNEKKKTEKKNKGKSSAKEEYTPPFDLEGI